VQVAPTLNSNASQPSQSPKPLPASATLVLRINIFGSKILNKKPPHF